MANEVISGKSNNFAEKMVMYLWKFNGSKCLRKSFTYRVQRKEAELGPSQLSADLGTAEKERLSGRVFGGMAQVAGWASGAHLDQVISHSGVFPGDGTHAALTVSSMIFPTFTAFHCFPQLSTRHSSHQRALGLPVTLQSLAGIVRGSDYAFGFSCLSI